MCLVPGKDYFESILADISILSLTFTRVACAPVQVAHTMAEKQCGIVGLPDIELNATFGFLSLPWCCGCLFIKSIA